MAHWSKVEVFRRHKRTSEYFKKAQLKRKNSIIFSTKNKEIIMFNLTKRSMNHFLNFFKTKEDKDEDQLKISAKQNIKTIGMRPT
jgi:hypothetical protein